MASGGFRPNRSKPNPALDGNKTQAPKPEPKDEKKDEKKKG